MLEAVHASSTLSAVVEEIRAGGANDEGGRMVAMTDRESPFTRDPRVLEF
jgi:hypothetical protein